MTALEGKTIGFIGLGLMGQPMARNLLAAGARLVVHNRSPGPARKLARAGAEVVETPREVAEQASIVIVMVSDTPAVQSVLFEKAGVAAGLGVNRRSGRGPLVIDMGTTDVARTRQFAKWVVEAGGELMDAPVSGGQLGARDGTLTIMAGGSKAAMARARPVLKVLGTHITHVGEVGAGQACKAVNQVIVGLTIGAVAEGLALARAAGVDPGKARKALQGGFAASRILDVHGERMVKGRFKPGGKAATQRKDLAQALALAKACGLDLPATRLNLKLYDRLIAAGGAERDHSALFTLYGE